MSNSRSRSTGRRPLLRFVLLLTLLFGLFNVVFYVWVSESAFFYRYLSLNARASVPLIRLFGAQAAATDIRVHSPEFALEIKHGCDALQPTAFFVLAMLASPVAVPLSRRLIPLFLGSAVLLLLNLVRILTLFYAGIKIPGWFEILHQDIWQAVFIFLPLLFWIAWAVRATNAPARRMHAAN